MARRRISAGSHTGTLVFFCPGRNHLVAVLLRVLRRALVVPRLVRVVVLRGAAGQPRVHQQLRRLEPLRGLPPQHAANQAPRLRRQPAGQAERPAADLGEQGGGLRVLKRVPPDQHGVQGHAQAPDVRGPTRVRPVPVGQQLGANVGGAAVSVHQKVVVEVPVKEDDVV